MRNFCVSLYMNNIQKKEYEEIGILFKEKGMNTRELAIAHTLFIVPHRQPRPGKIEILAVIHGARRPADILTNS